MRMQGEEQEETRKRRRGRRGRQRSAPVSPERLRVGRQLHSGTPLPAVEEAQERHSVLARRARRRRVRMIVRPEEAPDGERDLGQVPGE